MRVFPVFHLGVAENLLFYLFRHLRRLYCVFVYFSVTGGLMINQGFLDLYLRNSLVQSVWTDIPETSCIQFMYIGNISALEFMIENEHTEERILWNDTHVSNVLYNGEWRQSQVVGNSIDVYLMSLIGIHEIPHRSELEFHP